MKHFMVNKWLLVSSIVYCSVSATEVDPQNNIPNTDSPFHIRFKRYHNRKPQFWSDTSLNFNQNFSHNSPNSNFKSDFSHYSPNPNFKPDFSHNSPTPSFNQEFSHNSPNPSFNQEFTHNSPIPSFNQEFSHNSPISSINQEYSHNLPNPSFNQEFSHNSPKPSYNQEFSHNLPKPSFNQEFSHNSPNLSFNQEFSQNSPISSINQEYSHNLPNPSFNQEFSHNSPKPSFNQEFSHNSPNPSFNQEFSHNSPNPSFNQEFSHHSPNPSFNQEFSHNSPKPSFNQEFSHNSPKPSFNEEFSHNSPKPSFNQEFSHNSPNPSFNQELFHNSPYYPNNAFPNGNNFGQFDDSFIPYGQTNYPKYETVYSKLTYPKFEEQNECQTQPNTYEEGTLTYSSESENNTPSDTVQELNQPTEAQPLVNKNLETPYLPLSLGDKLNAYIFSNRISVPDGANVLFRISPTGLLLEDPPFVREVFSPFMCNETYQAPSIPDFRDDMRRISDVKCYEYIWEMLSRKHLEKRNKMCNITTRSKRSENSWSHLSLHPSDENQQNAIQNVTSQQTSNSDTNVTNTFTTLIEAGISFSVSKPEEFPHMAALGWRGVNEEYVFKCGGSLISHKFVLTAAHCTYSGPDPSISDRIPRIVRIGGVNIGFRANGQSFNVADWPPNYSTPEPIDVNIINIITHEQYNPNMRYFDIALLELEYEVEFNRNLQPACLWTNRDTSDRLKTAVAAGWGVVDVVTMRTTSLLQAGELDIIDTPTCNRLLLPSFGRKFDGVADHQICAGNLSGGIDVCQGDSGGPLQVKISLPQYEGQGSMHTIVGIISAGVGCAKPDTPGIYTRVSSFLDWIEKYVWP